MRDKLVSAAELVPEKAFTLHVLEYAVKQGWLVMHVSDSRRSYSAGYPDILFVKPGCLIFGELKSVKAARAKNQGLAKAQERWRDVLRQGPADWYLWTPADWDEIEAVLGPGVT